MSEIAFLRKTCVDILGAKGEISLVNLMGFFDARMHAIFTPNEINQAIKGLQLGARRLESDIVLVPSTSGALFKAADADVEFLYECYLRLLKRDK